MRAATFTILASSVFILSPNRTVAGTCPAFGGASDCGAIITITNKGSTISFTGQGPYDGSDDPLVGVINNSKQSIYALGLKSNTDIFGFDGDGIITYGAPGNAKDTTGYGGPNSYFSNYGGNNQSGVVNFVAPLQPGGGTTYFSLEEALTKPTAIQDIVNNSIAVTLGGRFSGTAFGALNLFRPTNITVVFTPNGGLTLAQAGAQTGFTGFDFVQTITSWPNPGLHQAGSPGSSLTTPPPFLDPPPGGYDYCVKQGWVACTTSYPFYPTTKTANTVTLFDSPRDPKLKPGQSLDFNDRLIGILPGFVNGTNCLVLGTCVDLGVGVDWTSNYNGSFGGIAETASDQPIDPATADGLGGITITNIYETTTYSPFVVTTINGAPVSGNTSGPTIDLSQPFFTENDSASRQSIVEFAGGILKPTTSYTFVQPVQLDATGGTVDSTNGNLAFTGVISGPGALTIQGGNAVALTNSNDYQGGTTILSGTLVVGNNNSAGTGEITIAGGALTAGADGLNISNDIVLAGPAVILGGAGVFTLSGGISGNGSLTTTGIGTTVLSGTGTYTGATTVAAGVLQLDGTLNGTSSVTVNSGATLAGGGTIISPIITVAAGGTLSPGTVGTAGASMNVTGDLALRVGSAYRVQVSPSAATFTNIIGSVSLAGSVQAISTGVSAYTLAGTSNTILKATTAIDGAFSAVSLYGDLANSVIPTLIYKKGEVELAFSANTISSQLPGNLSQDQLSVAHGIDAILATNKAPSQFVNLFALSSTTLPGVLTGLAGENAASVVTSTITAGSNFLGNLLDPSIESHHGTTAAGSPFLAIAPEASQYNGQPHYTKGAPELGPSPWSLWATGTGLSAQLEGSASTGGSSVGEQFVGVAGGADYRGVPGLVLGFGIGGAEAWTQVKNGLGGSRSDIFQIGGYAVQKIYQSGYVAGAFAYSNADSHTNRTVAINGEALTGRPNTDLFGGRIEAGFRFSMGRAGLTPYGAVEVESANTGAYRETSSLGAPVFGLSFQSRTNTNLRVEAGTRFDVATNFGTLFGRVAYVHQDLTPAITGLFEALPATAFTIRGARLPENAALVSLGTELRLAPHVKLSAQAAGEIAPKSDSIAGRVTLRYDF